MGGLHFLSIKHPQMFIDLGTPCLPACFVGSPSSLTLPFCCSPGAQVIQPCGWVISHSSPILQLDVCLRPSLAWCGWASTVCFDSETFPSSESDSRGRLGFLAGFGKYQQHSPSASTWVPGWHMLAIMMAGQAVSKHFSTPQLANSHFQELLGWNQEILRSSR